MLGCDMILCMVMLGAINFMIKYGSIRRLLSVATSESGHCQLLATQRSRLQYSTGNQLQRACWLALANECFMMFHVWQLSSRQSQTKDPCLLDLSFVRRFSFSKDLISINSALIACERQRQPAAVKVREHSRAAANFPNRKHVARDRGGKERDRKELHEDRSAFACVRHRSPIPKRFYHPICFLCDASSRGA